MKTCGKCKCFSKTNGDCDADDYPDGGDWGWCFAPTPMVIEDVGNREVDVNQKAKHCKCYGKKKKTKILLLGQIYD